MPSADCLSEVPLNRSTSTHTQDLDRLITGSRTNTEVSHKRHSCDNRFPGRPETLPGKMSNPRRFLPFSFRSSCSHSIFTLFLALTIVHSVFGKYSKSRPSLKSVWKKNSHYLLKNLIVSMKHQKRKNFYPPCNAHISITRRAKNVMSLISLNETSLPLGLSRW